MRAWLPLLRHYVSRGVIFDTRMYITCPEMNIFFAVFVSKLLTCRFLNYFEFDEFKIIT